MLSFRLNGFPFRTWPVQIFHPDQQVGGLHTHEGAGRCTREGAAYARALHTRGPLAKSHCRSPRMWTGTQRPSDAVERARAPAR
jgi:hypothetical protein